MKYILAENDKGVYVIPKADLETRKVARILKNGGEQEPEIVKIIGRNSGDGVVIHAGAYIGDMIPAISKCVKKLIAFEPNREAYNCACATKYLNDCQNTTVMNCALSDQIGRGILKTDQYRNVSHPLVVSALVEREEVVRSVTIDTVVRYERCSVIHLDVELHEVQALKGAKKTIERFHPVLIIEDLYNELNDNPWFKKNILSEYKEVKKIGVNRVYKCEK